MFVAVRTPNVIALSILTTTTSSAETTPAQSTALSSERSLSSAQPTKSTAPSERPDSSSSQTSDPHLWCHQSFQEEPISPASICQSPRSASQRSLPPELHKMPTVSPPLSSPLAFQNALLLTAPTNASAPTPTQRSTKCATHHLLPPWLRPASVGTPSAPCSPQSNTKACW